MWDKYLSNPTKNRQLHEYSITTDFASEVIEARSADEAVRKFMGQSKIRTSAQLRTYLERSGGYGSLREDGHLIWKVGGARALSNPRATMSWFDRFFGKKCWVVLDRQGRILRVFGNEDDAWAYHQRTPRAYERKQMRVPGC